MGTVGVFLRLGLVTPLVRGQDQFTGLVVAVITLVAQGDESGVAQGVEDLPDPGGGGVVSAAGQFAGDPQDGAIRRGDHLQVHAVHLVLAGVCAVRRLLFEWR